MTGEQITTIPFFPNIKIPRSKSSQAMKFGQLIQNNMRKIFLKKNTPNEVEKLVPDPFLKSQN